MYGFDHPFLSVYKVDGCRVPKRIPFLCAKSLGVKICSRALTLLRSSSGEGFP